MRGTCTKSVGVTAAGGLISLGRPPRSCGHSKTESSQCSNVVLNGAVPPSLTIQKQIWHLSFCDVSILSCL